MSTCHFSMGRAAELSYAFKKRSCVSRTIAVCLLGPIAMLYLAPEVECSLGIPAHSSSNESGGVKLAGRLRAFSIRPTANPTI